MYEPSSQIKYFTDSSLISTISFTIREVVESETFPCKALTGSIPKRRTIIKNIEKIFLHLSNLTFICHLLFAFINFSLSILAGRTTVVCGVKKTVVLLLISILLQVFNQLAHWNHTLFLNITTVEQLEQFTQPIFKVLKYFNSYHNIVFAGRGRYSRPLSLHNIGIGWRYHFLGRTQVSHKL